MSIQSVKWKVPLADLSLDEEERLAVLRVLDSKWLTMGEVTAALEGAFARYVEAPHGIAVSSGTAALHIAAQLLGLGPGDEVLTPALTFVASVNAIVYTGARPVFVDVRSLEDWTIDPDDAQKKITPATRAIFVVHYGGYLCDMGAITTLARQHQLGVVEDAAHAPGARYDGKPAGTLGDVGCFSFFANKNLTSAEGGMVVTSSGEWAERARRLRSHGMTTVTWQRHAGHASSYDVLELGYNYRISDLHAAIGLAQLQKLDGNNARREALVARYVERLRRERRISLPFLSLRGKPAYHIFPILLGEDVDRQEFMQALKSRGIQTSVHYPPVHLFSWYRKQQIAAPGTLPLTEQIGRRMVTLPLYPTMGEEAVDAVAEAVHESLSR
jgi:dTDP-4-amino-4,6-dideoxygalactose transaminase